MTSTGASTARSTITSTTLTRMRECAVTDRAELDRLLDDNFLAHVGMADDQGGVVVIPTAVVRDRDRVLVHGSTGSGWMRRAAAGPPVCLTVTDPIGMLKTMVAASSRRFFGRTSLVRPGMRCSVNRSSAPGTSGSASLVKEPNSTALR